MWSIQGMRRTSVLKSRLTDGNRRELEKVLLYANPEVALRITWTRDFQVCVMGRCAHSCAGTIYWFVVIFRLRDTPRRQQQLLFRSRIYMYVRPLP